MQNETHFKTMREELEDAAVTKIQNYVRKVLLPRRMAEKMRKPDQR